MICASRGPAFGLCGRPTPLRWGEEAAAPAKPIVGRRRDKFKVRQPPELRVVNPTARGRSVAHTTERAMRRMRPLLGRERGRRSDPAFDRASVKAKVACPM
jgi:hypothetical protein